MAKKKIAIVTGASRGLGLEFVKLLLKEDLDEIWMIARSEEKMKKIKEKLGKKIVVCPMDLSRWEEIKELGERFVKEKVYIMYLINNAGMAKFCSYGDLSVEESLHMVNLNISGVVAMGLVCLPFMGKGSHVVNIASQAAFQPLPYQNIYSSTKAFVRNYTRALNVELKGTGIQATAVCPGWMNTELIERGKTEAKKATHRFLHMVTPQVVAKKAMKDVKKGKDISVYSLYVKMCHLTVKILPQRVAMKLWLRQQKMVKKERFFSPFFIMIAGFRQELF